jgi:Tfp pilus assembly protein PilF
MAKQRRLSSRPAARKRASALRRPDEHRAKAKAKVKVATRAQRTRTAPAPVPDRGMRGDSHEQAVQIYEHGVEALQQRDFRRAQQVLQSVLDRFPDEKELHERVRLYLNVCRRQAAPPDRTPRSVEERVYAATLAINAGAYDTARTQLHAALQTDAEHGNVHYMLAVVHALCGNFGESTTHLQRSIEINPENRFLALQDEDLAALRAADSGFRSMVDSAFTARRERRARPSR